MLVLSRKERESIILTITTAAGDVTVAINVLKIDGCRAKIGVDAPRDVSIKRSELISQEISHE
jgi:carbon storage regulator CsrA